MFGSPRGNNDKNNIKVKTLTSFVYDGWRFIVTLLLNVRHEKTYLQVSTLLGHIPLIPGGNEQRSQLGALLKRTQTFGHCRMMVNDRKMIFLLAQKEVSNTIGKSPREITAITTELVLEAKPLLGIYKRFLVSE